MVPANVTLLALPPYSPELNPVDRIWHYLRSHWLANSVFQSLADIMDACEMAWNRFAADHASIRSLCAVAWAPASPAHRWNLLHGLGSMTHPCPEISGDPYYTIISVTMAESLKSGSNSVK